MSEREPGVKLVVICSKKRRAFHTEFDPAEPVSLAG